MLISMSPDIPLSTLGAYSPHLLLSTLEPAPMRSLASDGSRW
jgi:hypothetical protein